MSDEYEGLLVCGDVQIDHHWYAGARPTPEASAELGTMSTAHEGGAALTYGILSAGRDNAALPEDVRAKLKVAKGWNLDKLEELPGSLHSYALWTPYEIKKSSKGGNPRVWRVSKALGYGHKSPELKRQTPQALKTSGEAQQPARMVIIDDAALGYRYELSEQRWPASILNKNSVPAPEWIILKMARPLCQGDLWWKLTTENISAGKPGRKAVKRRVESYSDRLIAIVSVNDIRREDAQVSAGISWERTASELAWELWNNPRLSGLLKCKHLIVALQAEGAFWVSREDGRLLWRLILDPRHMEREWEQETMEGRVFGGMSCITAAAATYLMLPDEQVMTDAEKKKNLENVADGKPPLRFSTAQRVERGIHAGLSASRHLFTLGHGFVDAPESALREMPGNGQGEREVTQLRPEPSFPYADVMAEILNTAGKHTYYTVTVPAPEEQRQPKTWRLLEGAPLEKDAKPVPLYGIARRIALFGMAELQGIPVDVFGNFITADQGEIEALRSIGRIIQQYRDDRGATKPLSIGVFGPPGAGKSFAVKQLAKQLLGDATNMLEFNLSQLRSADELSGAFHQVRDEVLRGSIPVVFWDEFDCRSYEWLKHLLAPMQDGTFLEGQVTHPIGKCIFVFAGGTCHRGEEFWSDSSENTDSKEEKERIERLRLCKVPDFASRLSACLNVIGPNRRETDDKDDVADICFPVRRALMIRGLLRLKPDQLLDIDRVLLTALLKVPKYLNGSRSLEKLLAALRAGGNGRISRADLPPPQILGLHVDTAAFYKIMDNQLHFQRMAPELAPLIHESYRAEEKKKGNKVTWDFPYDDLPAHVKDSNIAAAFRMYELAEMAGLQIVGDEEAAASGKQTSETEVHKILNSQIERLAAEEHEGWMLQKYLNAYKEGTERKEEERRHTALVPYAELSEEDRDKDRSNVRKMPAQLKEMKYRLVKPD